ncbi:MAG: glucoamylase family protein [Bacteroidales bacterium]|nr:glucoamylase family protein [Bacteroidales bacterium]
MVSPVKPILFLVGVLLSASAIAAVTVKPFDGDKKAFTRDLKQRTFNFFWDRIDANTWQTDDRFPTKQFTSIAATGFGLTSYIIGIHNGFISREDGASRVLKTLEWMWQSPQGSQASGVSGYKGFYYHFLNYDSGTRFKTNELSTIDTGLLMAGVLTCQSWFTRDNSTERRIRELADSLYLRVQWDWAMNGQSVMSMGWTPEKGFIPSNWTGYNEAMILLIMAVGSPSHPIPAAAWAKWCTTYQWAEFYGYEYVNFSPLFGHQYSQMYIDFKGIQDEYMKARGIDYFENSRRATLSNRAYCSANPLGFVDYSSLIWGLTASDGPASENRVIGGRQINFATYSAKGCSALYINDDGTIAPTAAGGSIPFEPEICINSLYYMKQKYGDQLYQKYGFKDAFNPTYTFNQQSPDGWFDIDYLGIDQGPILIQLENYETGLIWNTLKRNPYIIDGLRKAGFTGGWLDQPGTRP